MQFNKVLLRCACGILATRDEYVKLPLNVLHCGQTH